MHSGLTVADPPPPLHVPCWPPELVNCRRYLVETLKPMMDSQSQPGSACNLTSLWPSSDRLETWFNITAMPTAYGATPVQDVISFVLNDCCESGSRDGRDLLREAKAQCQLVTHHVCGLTGGTRMGQADTQTLAVSWVALSPSRVGRSPIHAER